MEKSTRRNRSDRSRILRARRRKRRIKRFLALSIFLLGSILIFLTLGKKAVSIIYETMGQKRIILDPGHGGEDPGSMVGPVWESNINLSIAKKVESRLKKDGYQVIMTRKKDETVELIERVNIEEKSDAILFVSIHQNSLDNDTVTTGIETWFNPNGHEDSQKLASYIQEEMVEATKAIDRGLKNGEELAVLKRASMPACLVECGFLSNQMEAEKLFKEDYQETIAEAIYQGIKGYLAETEKEEIS